jgi:electron transfer flavoprotein alpha subunit
MSASGDIWVYVDHLKGVVVPQTFELLSAGRTLARTSGGQLTSVLLGRDIKALAAPLGAVDTVLAVEDDRLDSFTPESHARTLHALAAERRPAFILCGATSTGIDLATTLAVLMDVPMIVNLRAVAPEEGGILVTSQLCGGKLQCEIEVSPPAVFTVLAGAFPAEAAVDGGEARLQIAPAPEALDRVRTKTLRLIEPDASDVDITREAVLVAVGRGIQRKENLPLAEELAGLLGGAVCASRPVIDQGWLPLSRQVGKSGMIVKPALYLALGISGASEHVEGMKDAGLIVAVNSDPHAPIFDVAHYGIASDLFDVMPALIEALNERRKAAA